MAYEVCYWQSVNKADELLKSYRIKQMSEIVEEGLVQSRPSDCDIVTLERTDKQSPYYKVLWQHPNYIELDKR